MEKWAAMALLGRKQDPANEGLRDGVYLVGDGPPNLEDEIPRLIEKTSKIHAGFLFDYDGKEVLKQLCLRLCSTGISMHYEGWKGFAHGLGLSGTEIEYIENHDNQHDPAYTTLEVFVQEHDSTLDKIVLSLRNIKRMDIILKIQDLLEKLADTVTNRQSITSEGDSGFYTSTEETDIQQTNQPCVIMPSFVPSGIPIALRKFRDSAEISSTVFSSTNYFVQNPTIENECVQMNANISKRKVVKDDTTEIAAQGKQQYKKIVMLTFASDGIEEAKEIASIFRVETKSHDRIGVLIFNDHAAKVNLDPEEFIFSSFNQVNYVMPIITKGYIEAVSQSHNSYGENSLLCLDPKYVKFIHTLMNTNYLHDGCVNMKVRCIIPDKSLHLAYSTFMKKPLFQAWARLSETEQLKEKILNAKI